MNSTKSVAQSTALRGMVVYGIGECAYSFATNGFIAFSMLYYTEALGLSPILAGMAMSFSVFWEAVTEPVMGNVSDRTRSRFGRRHPWMLGGGLLMAVFFFFIWAVPPQFRTHPGTLFSYLLVMNLFLRTALSMFFIPYLALGFDVYADYDNQARVQGIRQILNMAATLAGPAMAWVFFFPDTVGADGRKIIGTQVPENFMHMGASFAVVTALLVLGVIWGTRHTIKDSRPNHEIGKLGFWNEIGEILRDPHPRWTFVFIVVVYLGMVLTASLQMYVYIYFMKFAPGEKLLAHSMTMVGAGLGGPMSAWLVGRMDKKGAVFIGGVISILANVMLGGLFLTGWISIGTREALVLFVFCHSTYWFANGIMLPVATAMISDAAAVHKITTGKNQDGGYSAIFSFAIRIAAALGFSIVGWVLSAIGFTANASRNLPAPDVLWRLGVAFVTFGPLTCSASLFAISRYKLTRLRFKQLTDYPTKVEPRLDLAG